MTLSRTAVFAAGGLPPNLALSSPPDILFPKLSHLCFDNAFAFQCSLKRGSWRGAPPELGVSGKLSCFVWKTVYPYLEQGEPRLPDAPTCVNISILREDFTDRRQIFHIFLSIPFSKDSLLPSSLPPPLSPPSFPRHQAARLSS